MMNSCLILMHLMKIHCYLVSKILKQKHVSNQHHHQQIYRLTPQSNGFQKPNPTSRPTPIPIPTLTPRPRNRPTPNPSPRTILRPTRSLTNHPTDRP